MFEDISCCASTYISEKMHIQKDFVSKYLNGFNLPTPAEPGVQVREERTRDRARARGQRRREKKNAMEKNGYFSVSL